MCSRLALRYVKTFLCASPDEGYHLSGLFYISFMAVTISSISDTFQKPLRSVDMLFLECINALDCFIPIMHQEGNNLFIWL